MKNKIISIFFALMFLSGIFYIFDEFTISNLIFGIIMCILFALAAVHFWTKDRIKHINNLPQKIEFEVRTWNEYAENIIKWQSQNARDLWVNGKYSEKPLYHYSWENNIPVNFVAEPTNEYDSKAIAVYLDGLHIGYVPREINIKFHDFILRTGTVFASIHGGDRKIIDEYGDLIVEKFNPIVEIIIQINN